MTHPQCDDHVSCVTWLIGLEEEDSRSWKPSIDRKDPGILTAPPPDRPTDRGTSAPPPPHEASVFVRINDKKMVSTTDAEISSLISIIIIIILLLILIIWSAVELFDSIEFLVKSEKWSPFSFAVFAIIEDRYFSRIPKWFHRYLNLWGRVKGFSRPLPVRARKFYS